MAQTIEMPKFGDEMVVGTLGRWLKNEGDPVKAGEALAEIETDKATLELESPADGILLKRFVGEGDKVPVDSPVCVVGNVGERFDAPHGAPPKPLSPREAEAGTVTMHSPRSPAPGGARIRISPLARRLAREKGISPATVAGSGPRGRILRMDILAVETRGLQRPPRNSSTARDNAPALSPAGPAVGPEAKPSPRIVPNSPMRAAIARRLVESKTEIPHFYLETEIDAAPLLALRHQLNATLDRDGIKISVNDFMLRASAFALLKVPEVNSSWAGESIHFHPDAHVSFAVAIDDGLITPVIRNTGRKSLTTISVETKAIAARAKDKKLLPAEFTGGTFCVTNLGMMGITRFSAIINPPNSAILAVGATVRKPVAQGDQIVIGERMTLTLSCDHRVVDGAIGARFLSELRGFLENPLRLLCDPLFK